MCIDASWMHSDELIITWSIINASFFRLQMQNDLSIVEHRIDYYFQIVHLLIAMLFINNSLSRFIFIITKILIFVES